MLPPVAVAAESAGVELAGIPVVRASLALRDQLALGRSQADRMQLEVASLESLAKLVFPEQASEQVSERGRVALGVVVGRGGEPGKAAARVRKKSMEF